MVQFHLYGQLSNNLRLRGFVLNYHTLPPPRLYFFHFGKAQHSLLSWFFLGNLRGYTAKGSLTYLLNKQLLQAFNSAGLTPKYTFAPDLFPALFIKSNRLKLI